jgi:hypothetical protein
LGSTVIAVAFVGACSSERFDGSPESRVEQIGTVSQAVTLDNGHSIEGYADRISAGPGDTVNIFVHVPARSTGDFTYELYRYGTDGFGGVVPNPSTPYFSNSARSSKQNYPDNAAVVGVSWAQPIDPVTGLAIAPLQIGMAWPAGFYAVKLTDSTLNAQGTRDVGYITLVVKGSAQPRMLVASTNTWQAYNFWPGDKAAAAAGLSLNYSMRSCGVVACDNSPTTAELGMPVSFLRPNPLAGPMMTDPSGPLTDSTCAARCAAYSSIPSQTPPWGISNPEHLTIGEIRLAAWLQGNSWSYSMMSDQDLNNAWTVGGGGSLNLSVLNPAVSPTLIISTHSEYWSDSMQRAASAYLKAGGNIVSLSGNTMNHMVSYPTNATLAKLPNDWQASDNVAILGTSWQSGRAGSGNCGTFTVNTPAHWTVAGLPTTLGGDGVEGHLAAPPSIAGRRLHCEAGAAPAGGAVGWELDAAPAARGFMRTYNVLAQGTAAPSSIVFARKASAGQIFSAGSIMFGQSLLWDSFQASKPLTTMMGRVLGRFSQRYFGDFNGDAKPDVLARESNGYFDLYRGDGAAGFLGGATIGSGWNVFDSILSPGDWDGDGHPDILGRCTAACGTGTAGNLLLYRGDGAGGWAAGGTVVGTAWDRFDFIVAPGDFDGDGNPDLLARYPWYGYDGLHYDLYLYSGNGTGGWLGGARLVATNWGGVDRIFSPGDFDGDGNSDVLTRSSTTGYLYLWSGDGAGGLLGSRQVGSGWDVFSQLFGAGDFDGDGKGDILAVTPSGQPAIAFGQPGDLRLYRGNGLGGFTSPVIAGRGWQDFTSIVSVW